MPGSYAANCLLARRLAERDVRFIQLYHRGWEQHNDLPRDLALQAGANDQASAALVQDLDQRGLLDDTLVVWAGNSYNVVADPVHVHDLQATIPHCLGVDDKRLTYKFQGRYFRLTDVHGEVVEPALA